MKNGMKLSFSKLNRYFLAI